MVMLFSSVGQNKRADLLLVQNGNIRWKFLFRSYIPRCRLESVIAKYSKHPQPVRWLTATHSPQNIRFIRAGALPEHSPRKQDNSASSCNYRFQTEMAIKRQNLQTLKRCHGSINSSDNGEKHYTQPYIHLQSHRPAKLWISPCI